MSRSTPDLGKRFVAGLIDWAIPIAIQIVGGLAGKSVASIAVLVSLAFQVYNYIYLQGTTGQTIGKKQQGIKLLKSDTGQPLGMAMAFVRWLLAGILSALCLLDIIIMLVDKAHLRLSDKILGNQVYNA
jgi:uncharacterized RDD family membrane protein YckC